MPDFDIRLYRADGSLSLIVKTSRDVFAAAKSQAVSLLQGEVVRAEIWTAHELLDTVTTVERDMG